MPKDENGTKFIASGNDLMRFVINIIVAAGLVTGILFFPINTKIEALEKEFKTKCSSIEDRVDRVEKDHERHCADSQKNLQDKLEPIKKSVEDLKKSVDGFSSKNAQFQEKLIDIIMELKK